MAQSATPLHNSTQIMGSRYSCASRRYQQGKNTYCLTFLYALSAADCLLSAAMPSYSPNPQTVETNPLLTFRLLLLKILLLATPHSSKNTGPSSGQLPWPTQGMHVSVILLLCLYMFFCVCVRVLGPVPCYYSP